MQFLSIVAILLTILVAESSKDVAPALPPWVGWVLLLGVVVHGWLGCRVYASRLRKARVSSSGPTNRRRFRVWLAFHSLIWVFSLVITLRLSGVAYSLAYWSTFSRLLFVDEFVLLAPAVLPLLGLWLGLYEVESACHGNEAGFMSRREYMGSHVRHHLLLVLVPLVLLLAVNDLITYLLPNEDIASFEWLANGLVIVGLIYFFPLLLRMVWKTTKLNEPQLVDALHAVTREYGLRVRDFLLWQTDFRMLNAAVTGFSRRFRYVLLTDGLLAHLTGPQIECVVRHELAHVKRGHMGLRLSVLLFPIWIVVNWMLAFAIDEWNAEIHQSVVIAGSLVYAAYVLIALSWISRKLEFDADLMASYREGSICSEAAWIYIKTLQQIADTSGENPHKKHWLHPSLSARARFVRDVAERPMEAESFRNGIRSLRTRVWVAFVVCAATIWTLSLLGT